jgi:hypothetical protein
MALSIQSGVLSCGGGVASDASSRDDYELEAKIDELEAKIDDRDG